MAREPDLILWVPDEYLDINDLKPIVDAIDRARANGLTEVVVELPDGRRCRYRRLAIPLPFFVEDSPYPNLAPPIH